MEKKYYLAIDIGASSGRHIIGYKENDNIILNEIYRFEIRLKKDNNHLIWDYKSIFKEIIKGLKLSFQKYSKIESLAIDTWGVDYGLLNGNDVIEPIFAYRDDRTLKVIPKVHDIIPFETLYRITGIQFANFNTIYQLYDDYLEGRLDQATDFLFLPALFSFMLTGKKKNEYTEASTSAMVDINSLQFSQDIISKLLLPKKLFKKIYPTTTTLGLLKAEIVNEVGGNTKVVLCASHDTASAFEAIDCLDDSLIISSGTWSLIGLKIKTSSTSESSRKTNFSNEGGVGYFRYLKNIMGMWLVNESIKTIDLTIKTIIDKARKSKYKYIFDVNDESLICPNNMIDAITNLLNKKGYPIPKNDFDLFSSIFHSLAYSYNIAVKEIESNLNIVIKRIYIVGGGAKNTLLNELTSKYTKKEVIEMPIEATAIGNIKIQMINGEEDE